MSEHHNGPVETGAPMNYEEHEKTYDLFIVASKYATILLVALLIAMAAGFYTAGGFIGGIITFFVLAVVGVIMFR
jgi:hypothetical protein